MLSIREEKTWGGIEEKNASNKPINLFDTLTACFASFLPVNHIQKILKKQGAYLARFFGMKLYAHKIIFCHNGRKIPDVFTRGECMLVGGSVEAVHVVEKLLVVDSVDERMFLKGVKLVPTHMRNLRLARVEFF